MNNAMKDEVNIGKLYGLQATLSSKDFIQKYQVKETGLSSNEAEDRLHNLGLNEIKQSKSKKWYHYFFESLFYKNLNWIYFLSADIFKCIGIIIFSIAIRPKLATLLFPPKETEKEIEELIKKLK